MSALVAPSNKGTLTMSSEATSHHHDRLRLLLEQVAEDLSDSPWSQGTFAAIGGLTEVGWSRDGAHLLVLSSSGRGVIAPATGEVLARDRRLESGDFDLEHVEAVAMRPIEDALVSVAGLSGGGLALMTADGWSLEIHAPRWPFHDVILAKAGSSLLFELSQPGRHLAGCRRVARCLEFRAAGFAPGGRHFVVATSDGLQLFWR